MRGLKTPATKAVTIAVNAAPMMMPTARSITLPRRMNSLKPLSTETPLLSLIESYEPAGPVGEFEDTVPDFGAGDFGAFVSPFELLFSDFAAGASDVVTDADSDGEDDDEFDDPDAEVDFSARLSLR